MTAYSTDGRYERATHRVMALVQEGKSIDDACYRAAADEGLGLMDFGKLSREAREHIPALIKNGELKVAKEAYQHNTVESRHLPLKQRLAEAEATAAE